MKYLLLHSATFDVTPISTALGAEGVEHKIIASADQLSVARYPTVLILDAASRDSLARHQLQRFVNEGGSIVALGPLDEQTLPDSIPESLVVAYLTEPFQDRQLLVALRTGFRDAAARSETQRLRLEAAARTRELDELTRIGMALNTERDYNALLELILLQARQITGSDAGSLYLVDSSDPDTLRFKLAQNHSRPEIPFKEVTIPIDHRSIAGYVASTNEPLVIDDAYFLPPDVEYAFHRTIDEKYGYRTKSMLTIPMTDHGGEVIGILQLINRKRHLDAKLESQDDFAAEIIPYSPRTVELVSALAGQAAVSIENSQLYEDIERLFEGFVRAAVTAIEQRDPTTSGHSERVAVMTVELAKAVERADAGTYRGLRFDREQLRELRYAGLLHDFGKVGVREHVLVKEKKLYAPHLALIKQRYAFIHRSVERNFERERANYLERHGRTGYDEFVEQLRARHRDELAALDRFLKLVVESNEPTILPEGNFEELLRFANVHYDDLENQRQPYLNEDEVRYLSIRKGSLDDAERLEIQDHVRHTYNFLLRIPWTSELKDIPTIAYGHHEKLNGSGYPRKVGGIEIPPQTRMMTISDIFDALTASDRPYKPAMPIDRALDILAFEVKDGMLDQELFDVFKGAGVYQAVTRPKEDGG
jgi:HD-GYP domain-containing protein (c-di-GMP phosphodiesterase class II)